MIFEIFEFLSYGQFQENIKNHIQSNIHQNQVIIFVILKNGRFRLKTKILKIFGIYPYLDYYMLRSARLPSNKR